MGITAQSAPSNHKALWQHYLGPFQLALMGYVVVATDYAGLGIGKDTDGKEILHEYMASPAHANDVVYSVQAARKAFRELSKKWVVIGHSQGGGSAWAVAQRQAVEPQDGYLGAVAVAPVIAALDYEGPSKAILGSGILSGINAAFPDLDLKEVLSPYGLRSLETIRDQGMVLASTLTLLVGGQFLQDDWSEHKILQEWQRLTRNGGKEIRGPMLVVHGEKDATLDISITTRALEETANACPQSRLEYVRLRGVTHNTALTAGMRVTMDWIEDRFQGVEVPKGLKVTDPKPARIESAYQPEINWFVSPNEGFWNAP